MSRRVSGTVKTFGCLTAILIFVALVFYPMFADIQENTRTVSCRSNLEKLGMALTQYSQDNDGAMPNAAAKDGTRTWRETIFSYVKSKDIYHCPDRNDAIDAHGFSQNYAANDSPKGAFARPGSVGVSLKSYPSPNKLILLLETEDNPRPDFDIDDPVLFSPKTQKIWCGHVSVHGNFLMADGHVGLFAPSNTYLYDPKNHSLFNFWYRNTDTRMSPNGEAVLKVTEKRFHWKGAL